LISRLENTYITYKRNSLKGFKKLFLVLIGLIATLPVLYILTTSWYNMDCIDKRSEKNEEIFNSFIIIN